MKMKSVWLALSLVLLFGFSDKAKLPDVRGTWLLKTEKHGNEAIKNVGTTTVKRKIITDTHFVWTEHDQAGNLLAMAGGTYLLEKGDIYTEKIEFAYPRGSMLLGASIPFDCQIAGNKWTHSGFLQYREVNSENGELEVIRTEKLSESWERLK